MKNLNILLFEFLESSCLAEGGDGSSALICLDYKLVADKFEAWLTQTENTWWERENFEQFVRFFHEQEEIWISSTENIHSYITTIIKTTWPI